MAREGLDLLRERVGDYCRATWLRDSAWSFLAISGGTVTGAAIGLQLETDDRTYILDALGNSHASNGDVARVLEDLSHDVPAGDLFALAVSPQVRGGGIGTALIERRLQAFSEAGFAYGIAESWVNSEDANSASLYRRLGFVELGFVPEYWKSEDEGSPSEDRRGCPVCGSKCVCDALIFAKRLSPHS